MSCHIFLAGKEAVSFIFHHPELDSLIYAGAYPETECPPGEKAVELFPATIPLLSLMLLYASQRVEQGKPDECSAGNWNSCPQDDVGFEFFRLPVEFSVLVIIST